MPVVLFYQFEEVFVTFPSTELALHPNSLPSLFPISVKLPKNPTLNCISSMGVLAGAGVGFACSGLPLQRSAQGMDMNAEEAGRATLLCPYWHCHPQ